MRRLERLGPVGTAVAWSVAYAVAMYAGRATGLSAAGLSLVWPAAGVGTVWLLGARGRAQAAVTVALCAMVGVGFGFVSTTPAAAFHLGLVATVHPVVAVVVLRRFGWTASRPPSTVKDVPVLLLSSAAAGVSSAAVGVAIFSLRFGDMWWQGAWHLSTRNSVSGFVATVVLLSLPRVREAVGPARLQERLLLATVTLVGTISIMWAQLPLLYLLVPLTVMVAMRCGPHLTSVLVGFQGVLIVIETLQASGPLVELISPELRVFLAQLLIMVLAVVGLVIAIEEHERFDALAQSKIAHGRLQEHINAALVANANLTLGRQGLVVETANPALVALCRTDRAHLLSVDPLTWFDPDYRPSVAAAVTDLISGAVRAWRWELRMDDAFGGGWVDAAMSPVRSSEGTVAGVNLQLLDITPRKRAEDRLAKLALHDQLTGLPNRALAGDRLAVALAQAKRTGLPVAVLYVDIDHFKQINDVHGHEGGDRLLIDFAERLNALGRSHDTVARLGGDEFVVICPAVGDMAQARQIADRIVRALGQPFEIGGEPIAITASVGVALATGRDGDATEVLRRADTALYSAKDHGRARYEVFSADAYAEAERSVRLLDELRTALMFDDLVMEYQPIVELATHRTVGLEALVRWRHPDHGLLMPRDFLDVLESSDLIFRLGEVAVRLACQEGAAHVAAGRPLHMHVNLSARELERPAIVETVRAVLQETGFPAELLTLEITETRLLRVGKSLRRDLGALRAMGVRIAVDDFGTGYSGPAHLVQIPLDALKLDRGFVDGVDEHRGSRAVCAGVLAMARGLGVGLIAEGIETEAQERALMELGYELGQGYLYSAAMPGSQVGDWIRSRAA